MTIKVKNCIGCPFVQYELEDNEYAENFGDEAAMCLAPKQIHSRKYDVLSYYKNYKSPK